MQNTWPEVPDLGRLRLARIKDVPRMAVVATASFYHSPVFQWERPYHAAHPKSTFESYKWLLAEYIRKPESVVVVAVDEGEPNEDDYTGATIVRDSGDSSATGDKDVIVGLAAYNLLPNTPRLGQFVDLDDKFGHHDRPYLVKGDDADKDIPAIYLLDHVIGPKIDKFFAGNLVLQGLAVHPAYRRRGHASTLVQWGLKLAAFDKVPIAVSSSANGEALYEKAGFRKIEDVTIHNKDKKTVYVSFWTTAPEAASS